MDFEQSRYTIRVDAKLLKKIRYTAQREGRSINQEITQLMLRKVKQFEEKEGPIPE